VALDFILTIDPKVGSRYNSHYSQQERALSAFWVDVRADSPDEASLNAAAAQIASECLGRPVSGPTDHLIAAVGVAFPSHPTSGVLTFSFRTGDRMTLRAIDRD
jgi:hypothetical protein